MPRTPTKLAAIRRSIQVQAPPTKIYQAFQSEEALSTWYMDGTTNQFRVGGTLSFEGPEGNVPATYTELIDNERIVLHYHGPWWGTVTWELKPTPKGTRITLHHDGFEGREEWITRFTWGWESFLKSLKAYAEDRPVK